MFNGKEDEIKMQLLEMLMSEMDEVSADKFRKKPVVEAVAIDVEPEEELESEFEEESAEDKLRRKIEALRK